MLIISQLRYLKFKLKNNRVIIKGYNEIADYCWNKLASGDIIWIQGYIRQTGEVIIEDIEKIK